MSHWLTKSTQTIKLNKKLFKYNIFREEEDDDNNQCWNSVKEDRLPRPSPGPDQVRPVAVGVLVPIQIQYKYHTHTIQIQYKYDETLSTYCESYFQN